MTSFPMANNNKENPPHKKLKLDVGTRGPLLDKSNIVTNNICLNLRKENSQPSPSKIVCRRYTRSSTIRNRCGSISPITANKYIPLTTVIHQGIPEGCQKYRKKYTLKRISRQGTLEGYYDDFFNNADLLEEIFYNQLNFGQWCILNALWMKVFHGCFSSRNAVINWLIQLQDYLNLPYQIIFTVVPLFDMVISSIKVAINMYQLVGITIMWIVSKNEDINTSSSALTMLAFCKGAYNKQQILKMEKKLLAFFDFRVNIANVSIFVVYYMKKLNIEKDYSNLFLNCVHYILECFTLNQLYSTKHPSVNAAAAVSLASQTLVQFRTPIICDLFNSIGLNMGEELKVIEQEMLLQVQNVQDPRFTFRQPFIKYKTEKYCEASVVMLQNLVAS